MARIGQSSPSSVPYTDETRQPCFRRPEGEGVHGHGGDTGSGDLNGLAHNGIQGSEPCHPPAPISCRSTVALRFLVLHASDEPPSPWPWSIARGNGAISDRETFIRGDVQIKTNVRPSLPLHDAVLSAPLDAAPRRRS
jgi:hypothetical protein